MWLSMTFHLLCIYTLLWYQIFLAHWSSPRYPSTAHHGLSPVCTCGWSQFSPLPPASFPSSPLLLPSLRRCPPPALPSGPTPWPLLDCRPAPSYYAPNNQPCPGSLRKCGRWHWPWLLSATGRARWSGRTCCCPSTPACALTPRRCGSSPAPWTRSGSRRKRGSGPDRTCCCPSTPSRQQEGQRQDQWESRLKTW